MPDQTKRFKRKLPGILAILFLILVSFISLFPFYMMFTMSSFKSELIFQQLPVVFSNYLMENLKTVFQSNFVQSYANSMLVSLVSMLVSTLVSAMAGYAMNVYSFRGKDTLYKFIMMTMMVPTQIGVIGYMIEMRNLHLNNTLLPLILVWFANGFGAYWMISFIKGALPIELVESARIDGANEIRIFSGIVLPCIKPGILTLCLLTFLWSWNSYMIPLVFINKKDLYTIPIFIKSLASAYRTDYGAQLCGLSLATIPLLILFIIGSKNFISGLTSGAVKG